MGADGFRSDPLLVVDPRTKCRGCEGKKCPHCLGSGLARATLRGLWSGRPAFLVCGGPSVNDVEFRRLAERGVASLGVNNAAGYVPVRAWTFGDQQRKFHHGLFFDPTIMSFVPTGKLKKGVRARVNGRFRATGVRVRDCPNTFGFSRSCWFDPPQFFSTSCAQWGGERYGKPKTMLLGFRLLYWLGVRRIYLLGVDLDRPSKEGDYCFDHPGSGGEGKYRQQVAMLNELRPVFGEYGLEVLNCSRRSRCEAFAYADFDAAVDDCKGAVPDEPWDLQEWYSQAAVKRDVEAFPRPVEWAELVADGRKRKV